MLQLLLQLREGSADALKTGVDPWLGRLILLLGVEQELRASMGAQRALQGATAGSRLVLRLMDLVR